MYIKSIILHGSHGALRRKNSKILQRICQYLEAKDRTLQLPLKSMEVKWKGTHDSLNKKDLVIIPFAHFKLIDLINETSLAIMLKLYRQKKLYPTHQ